MLTALLILSGCASLLPTGKTTLISPWRDYESAQLEYEKIIPGTTTVDELNEMNFDPHRVTNIRIMNVTDIIAIFMPNPSIRIEDLEPGIRECIEKRDRCTAYRIEPSVQDRKRIGNFWLDLFTFKQHEVDTGWEFRGLITMVDNVVTYRDPAGGRPKIQQEQVTVKPLGPLQDIGAGIGAAQIPRIW
jgi:hypothetical protein